jgi:hypothetical protein
MPVIHHHFFSEGCAHNLYNVDKFTRKQEKMKKR